MLKKHSWLRLSSAATRYLSSVTNNPEQLELETICGLGHMALHSVVAIELLHIGTKDPVFSSRCLFHQINLLADD